jgi:cell division protein FtsI/penicillin-binding protein 2
MKISEKANKTLRFLLLAFLLILFRIWQLSILQRDHYHDLAQKPKRKTIIEPAERGTICDRDNLGLALNRICYNAAVYYSQISQINSVAWKKDDEGKKVKYYPRREHIQKLSLLLGDELGLDPERVVDLIYSKAALLPHTPFIIKENISEKEYARLRMLEKDWAGLHAQIAAERFYPQKKTACDVLGYMSAIGQDEYISIASEIKELEDFLGEKSFYAPAGINSTHEAMVKLRQLKEKAYTINDSVGKSGLEKSFEKELRGFYGTKIYEIDIKGNFLQELQGSKDRASGKKVVLSLSAELQEFAEALLAEEEKNRERKEKDSSKKYPWIKGGAIVALDPNTGEVLALASYPRFDPNDYVAAKKGKKNSKVHQWLESEEHIARLWDGKEVLTKELYSFEKKEFYEETLPLTWDAYLDFLLPEPSEIRKALSQIDTVKKAILLQEEMEKLLFLSGQTDPMLLIEALFPQEEVKKEKNSDAKLAILYNLKQHDQEAASSLKKWSSLFSNIPSHSDKLFIIDLCRLAVFSPAFSDELLEKMGSISISSYREFSKEVLKNEETVKSFLRKKFHETEFKAWRCENEKAFLKEKRAIEKEKKTYARPYIDYLDHKEAELFAEFWQKNRAPLLASFLKGEKVEECPYADYLLTSGLKASAIPPQFKEFAQLSPPLFTGLLKTVRPYRDLDRPLYHKNARLRKKSGLSQEKHLAASFYPLTGFGYSRSYAFRQAATLGSNFKLVTAYAALKNRLESKEASSFSEINPLTMIDEFRWDAKSGKKGSFIVGYSTDHTPYPRMYKGGRLPRSSHLHMGKIDLLSALEQSSNPYFALLASDHLKAPEDLIEAAKDFGFGQKTGIALPGEIAGSLPDGVDYNRTGLYSFAIGQHSLVVTPLQTAVMLSAVASQGKIYRPGIVKELSGKNRKYLPDFTEIGQEFPYQSELSHIGIHFPLFTEGFKENDPLNQSIYAAEIKRELFFPSLLRKTLMDGLDRVVSGEKGSARSEIIKALRKDKDLLQRYKDSKHTFIGKTSTSEVLYNPYLYPSAKASLYKHAWFGAISFPNADKTWDNPELIVVVYLRFKEAGKEAAPIAFRMAEKYRQLKDKK